MKWKKEIEKLLDDEVTSLKELTTDEEKHKKLKLIEAQIKLLSSTDDSVVDDIQEKRYELEKEKLDFEKDKFERECEINEIRRKDESRSAIIKMIFEGACVVVPLIAYSTLALISLKAEYTDSMITPKKFGDFMKLIIR